MREEKPEPPTQDETPYSRLSWSELVGLASTTSTRGQGAIVEASRRVVKAQEVSERSATQLGKRISWLNLWLLVFTVAIFVLTGVLVWTSLREVGDVRRQSPPASSGAGSGWALWERVSWFKQVNPPSTTVGKLPDNVGWTVQAAVPTYTACNDAAKRQAERKTSERAGATNVKVDTLIGGGFSSSADVKNPDGLMYVEERCFPDTVDPRGSKGN